MAVLAFGALGAWAGSSIASYVGFTTFMGMSGASLGWLAGSTLGSQLMGPKMNGQNVPDTYGRRLTEIGFTGSQYGAPIPRVHGSARLPGNIIYKAAPIEHAIVHTESYQVPSGNKFGGKDTKTVSNTTYEYTVTFAVQVCLGPILGIRRIWADKQIIYDKSENITTEVDVPSGTLTIFLGTENQLLPLENSYRGTVILYFENFNVTPWGDRIPFIEVEVVTTGTISGTRITRAPVTVASIISSTCADHGIAPADLDLTGMTAEVTGYIAVGGTIQDQLDPVLQAMRINSWDSGGLLKFAPRGGSSAYTIDESELYAGEDIETTGSKIKVTNVDELVLPGAVYVTYNDIDRDHQPNTQLSRRHFGIARNEVNISFQLSMSADQAAQLADILLYNAWIESTQYEFILPRKYADLEPNDVVTIVTANNTYKIMIGKITIGVNGALECAGVAFDDAALTSTRVGATSPVQQIAPSSGGATHFGLLDIAAIQDTEGVQAGFYAAACGDTDNWHYCVIYRSRTALAGTWEPVVTLGNRTPVGTANTALANNTHYQVRDLVNTVDVVLSWGTLSSTTYDGLLAGDNLAILGNEIIQYQTATLIGVRTYRLSGLLRGRRGSEQYVGTHVINERFIPLANAVFVPFDVTTDYGLYYYYRAVANGMTIDVPGGTDQQISLFGNNMKPFAPTHVKGTRNTGDLTVVWTRRNRLGRELPISGGDIAMSETTESYRVEVLSALDVILRTVTVTSPTWTYTAANQTTDFGSPQSSIKLRIAQMSSIVGAGYITTTTL